MKCKCGEAEADILFGMKCIKCYYKGLTEKQGYCKTENLHTGWICPKCGYVWAIWVDGCANCNVPQYEIKTTGFSGDGTDASNIKP